MKKVKGQKNENNSGFTLIELLLTLALISILTGSMLTIARFSDTNKNLTLAKDQVRGAIRTAQSYSLSIPNTTVGNHVCGFGFYRSGSSQYKVYYTMASSSAWDNDPRAACLSCDSYGDCTTQDVMTQSLPQNVDFDTSNFDVFFSAPYGEVTRHNGSTITIGKVSGSGTDSLSINSSGEIK